MRFLIGLLILAALGGGIFALTLAFEVKKGFGPQDTVEKIPVTVKEGFILIAKSDEDIKKALLPMKSALYEEIKKEGFITENKKDGTFRLNFKALKKAVEGKEPHKIAEKLREEECFDEEGDLSRLRTRAKLQRPSPLAEALERNKTSLNSLYKESKFETKDENGAFNWFGIRQSEDGSITLVPSKVIGFKIEGESGYKRAIDLVNKHLGRGWTVPGMKSMLLGMEELVASDGTICLPLWFEIEVALLVENPIGFSPEAKVYSFVIDDEIRLHKYVKKGHIFTRDTNFKGDKVKFRSEILKQRPELLMRNGALRTPIMITVNPMKRRWQVANPGLNWSSEGADAGIIFWLNFPHEFPELFDLMDQFIGFPEGMTVELLKKQYLGNEKLADETGALRLPIGTYIATNGSGVYRMFAAEDEKRYLVRRPLADGRYDLYLYSKLNLIGSVNYLIVDAGYPSSYSFEDLEKRIKSNYPEFVVAKRIRFPIVLRVTPKGVGKPGFEALEMGSGKNPGLKLANQQTHHETGLVTGRIDDAEHLIAAARLLRRYFDDDEELRNLDEYSLQEALMMDERFGKSNGLRYTVSSPTGPYPNIYLWIDVEEGDYRFLNAEQAETQIEFEDPEQFRAFAKSEGFDNDKFLEKLQKSNIRLPFVLIFNPYIEKDRASERYKGFINIESESEGEKNES